MILFTLCLDPLLRNLDDGLNAQAPTCHGRRRFAVAYADDVTIILKSPSDIQIVQEAINNYAAASGAQLNIRKSKSLALGTWNTATPIREVTYQSDMKTLVIRFSKSVRQTAILSWKHITGNIRAQAQAEYHISAYINESNT
jgi:hypothetical protein